LFIILIASVIYEVGWMLDYNLIVLLFLVAEVCLSLQEIFRKENEIYISITGSDANPGTISKPFATLECARFPNKTAKKPVLYAVSGTDSSVVINKNLLKELWGKELDTQINIVPNWKFFNQWDTIKSVDFENEKMHLKNSELHA
jgi:hypothetical protein